MQAHGTYVLVNDLLSVFQVTLSDIREHFSVHYEILLEVLLLVAILLNLARLQTK